jgi:hypothetical protein
VLMRFMRSPRVRVDCSMVRAAERDARERVVVAGLRVMCLQSRGDGAALPVLDVLASVAGVGDDDATEAGLGAAVAVGAPVRVGWSSVAGAGLDVGAAGRGADACARSCPHVTTRVACGWCGVSVAMRVSACTGWRCG